MPKEEKPTHKVARGLRKPRPGPDPALPGQLKTVRGPAPHGMGCVLEHDGPNHLGLWCNAAT